jgi:hypothetical protein
MEQEILQHQNHCPSTALCRHICLQLRAEMSNSFWKENEHTKNEIKLSVANPVFMTGQEYYFYGLQFV